MRKLRSRKLITELIKWEAAICDALVTVALNSTQQWLTKITDLFSFRNSPCCLVSSSAFIPDAVPFTSFLLLPVLCLFNIHSSNAHSWSGYHLRLYSFCFLNGCHLIVMLNSRQWWPWYTVPHALSLSRLGCLLSSDPQWSLGLHFESWIAEICVAS